MNYLNKYKYFKINEDNIEGNVESNVDDIIETLFNLTDNNYKTTISSPTYKSNREIDISDEDEINKMEISYKVGNKIKSNFKIFVYSKDKKHTDLEFLITEFKNITNRLLIYKFVLYDVNINLEKISYSFNKEDIITDKEENIENIIKKFFDLYGLSADDIDVDGDEIRLTARSNSYSGRLYPEDVNDKFMEIMELLGFYDYDYDISNDVADITFMTKPWKE